MKDHYRRLFWCIFSFTLILALAIVVIYIVPNFTGIGPVPVRSAFAGRLSGVSEGDQRRFQFFYTTNRVNNADTFNAQGNELGDQMSSGTFDVLISPYLSIKPFVWFDKTSMKWAGRQQLEPDQFLSKLRQAVLQSPQKSLLVIVWGFRDWFQSAALKSAYTAYALDINTPVLLFDWPGNQGEGRQGYTASQEMSARSAPDLGRILVSVFRDTGAENVWVMGSSLGCQTISDSFAWLTTQPDIIQGKPKISHVVFSAPDVSAEAFDEKFSERILQLTRHLTVYVSSNDRALLMSHWLNGSRRLGRKAEVLVPPENRGGQYEFEEAFELLELQAKGAKNIEVIDATPINTTRNLHHFFTDAPPFFDDLYQRLLQPDDIISRRLHSVRTGRQGTTYWILWND